MKRFAFIFILLLAECGLAATTLRFLPLNRNALAMVRSQDMFGNTDGDFAKLYSLLNVPEQDGPLGKGKGLQSRDKGFNLSCGASKVQCQVVLNTGAGVVIDPAGKYMSYRAEGAEARSLTAAFFLDTNQEVFYLTGDRLFRIRGNSELFVFEASQNGF